MATALSNFVEYSLKDEMFRRLPEIVPELRFKKWGRDWHSPLKLDLSEPKERRADKCVVTEEHAKKNRSLSILENGESGNAEGVIDFYMRRHNLSFIEAVKDIAGKLGMAVPDRWDEAKYKEWEERQNALERVSRKMGEALFGSSGVEALDYLKGTRGYSEDFIRAAGFGFCDRETAKEIARAFGKGINRAIGETHTLSIPYRTGGRIYGFVFRTCTEGQNPKYLDAFISENATKKYHLFGLPGLSLKGDEEQRREIVIVEGEIDALRASFAGVRNVCGAAGGNIYPEAIEEAKARGVERVKLLFDTGEGGTAAKIEKAVGIISGFGLASFVCTLPEEEGGKRDPDSFLKSHTGQELQTLLDGAEAGYVFLFRKLLADSVERQGGDGEESTFTDINIFTRETLRLYESRGITVYERGAIASQFEEATGKVITAKMLAEEAERRKREEDTERQRRETLETASEALRLAKDGKTAEAIEEMGRSLTLKGISREAEYERLLKPQTRAEILQGFREAPTGIETQYFFRTSHGGERLVIPRGALTYICAPTSHGKSRMLENLAVHFATDGQAGAVLYFTFEEDRTAVQMEILNIFANMELSKNNLRTLRTYYSRGEEQFFKAGTDKRAFTEKQEAFLNLCGDSGRLRIYYEDWDSEALIGFVRHAAERERIKAVFIDYIQLLHKRGTNLQRKEELKEICKDFMRLSIDTELPIVLAAQLNREAYSPVDMTVQNIAEASDIEHSANTVMLLWNSSSFPNPKENGYFYKSKGEEKLTKQAEKIEGRNGFHIGQPGHIYALLAKNRGGERNASAVLRFDGNTGAIHPEEEDMPETITTEKALFE